MQKYGKGAFLTLVHLVRGILDAYSPSSVFNGSSGDPGPVFIQKIREWPTETFAEKSAKGEFL
jgi:hypothetical protein